MLVGGCATTGARTPGDPYEGFNRSMWSFNRGVDKVVLKPASSVYRTVTPPPARRGLSRVFANLSEPFSALNALLQGKPKRALNSLGRFLVNTTIGVGGLADHATDLGLKPTPEDFGQTLHAWGVRSSAYLVLPILGPSTVRDGIGAGAAQFLDPYRVCLRSCNLPSGLPTAVNLVEVVNTRSQLTDAGADAFLDSSADSYATARSAFLQRRAAQLADQDDGGAPGPAGDDADFDAALRELDSQGGAPGSAPPPGAATNDPAMDAALRELEQQQSAPAQPRNDTATPATVAPSGDVPAATPPRLPVILPEN